MSPRRLAILVLVAVALPAEAETRSGSFGITVRVVRSLPVATAPAATTAFVSASPSVSLPCGTASSATCGAAAARSAAGGAAVVTTFPDGAPTAVVER